MPTIIPRTIKKKITQRLQTRSTDPIDHQLSPPINDQSSVIISVCFSYFQDMLLLFAPSRILTRRTDVIVVRFSPQVVVNQQVQPPLITAFFLLHERLNSFGVISQRRLLKLTISRSSRETAQIDRGTKDEAQSSVSYRAVSFERELVLWRTRSLFRARGDLNLIVR